MKRINIILNLLLLTSIMIGLSSCQWDPYDHDIEATVETLTLTASTTEITLEEESLKDLTLTFDWTEARQMSDDYVVTYTTKLDVLGNNFGSTTVIQNTEDDGVYSRSFTGEQINNWYNDLWSLPINTAFTLQFRVSAQWSGGPTFEAPEVRTVEVVVNPIKVFVFDADKVMLSGSAMAGYTTEISATKENSNQFAWYGNLYDGELTIPVELDGVTYYICPVDGEGTLMDGQPEEVEMTDTAVGWTIPSSGNYRIVINMEDKTVTIYSEATDMTNLSVTFYPNGDSTLPSITMEVTNTLYAYGAGTGWGVTTLTCEQSLADPQILIYDGSLSSGMKFCVSRSFTVDGTTYNQNNSYCFTCPLTDAGESQSLSLTLDKVGDLNGGSDRNTRNSYYIIPSGTTRVIFDLRNMTILCTTAE